MRMTNVKFFPGFFSVIITQLQQRFQFQDKQRLFVSTLLNQGSCKCAWPTVSFPRAFLSLNYNRHFSFKTKSTFVFTLLNQRVANAHDVLYIVLKTFIRRFRICNYFLEILKFRHFMNAFK